MAQRILLSRRRVCQLAILLLASVLGLGVSAGAQGTGGVIAGTLTDQQGGVLPGVTLTLRNLETGVTRTSVSEGDGQYRLAGLPPGRYDLTAELQGFATAEVKDLTITIGLELRRDITMALQGLQESVTVTGEAPVVETTRTEVAAVVTQEQIESLPIANRQPITLALLLPGTSMDQTSGRRSQANIGGGGSSNAMNAYHVDGGMNWSNNSGQQHLEVPQSAIREFKVNISQSTAEFGGNLGGVVSTVTKSGTNRFSGEAFEYFRDKSLNALNKFEQERHDQFGTPKPDYRRDQYGVALGGPILKDRLHFFVAAERPTVKRNFTVSTGQPQFYSALEGTFPTNYERRMYFARGDLQLTSQQSLLVRYSYDMEIIGCETCGGTVAANGGPRVRSPRDSNLVGHTWVLGSRAVNEFRAQIPPSHLNHRQGPAGTSLWPPSKKLQFPPERFEGYVQVYEFPSLTWGATSWSMNWTDRLEFRDDFSHTFGSHTVKVGGAYIRLFSPEEQPINFGTWVFGSDQFFDGTAASVANLRNPIQFTASFPPLPRALENHWIQGYIQDEWKVRSNLTLDLGLRYDNQYKSFNTHLDLSPVPRLTELIDPTSRGDNNNVAPRVGIAWDLNDDGRSVLRSAYGLYYQYIMQGGLRPELTALRQTSIVIRNPSYPDPYGGRSPEAFASTAPPNVSILDDNLRNPSAHTANVGFSQEVGNDRAIHVDGTYSRLLDVNQTANINTPDPVTGQRPLPTWGRIVELQSAGKHEYKALFLRFDKRYSNRHQYLISYTLAKQDNTGAGNTPYVTDLYNPGLDWGPGSADRRHAFVASGSVLLRYDINVGAVWTLRSTMPFSARAGLDLNRDGNTSADYVPGTTRNQGNRDNPDFLNLVNAWRAANGRAPISADQNETNEENRLDVRVSKAFPLGGTRKVELIAQVFNLLGSDILVGIGQGAWVENALSNTFGRITTAQPNREGELAVRFVW